MKSRKETTVAASNGSTRRRNQIYHGRKVFALRMSLDLNRRLLERCDRLQVPANTYITGLIQNALARAKPVATAGPPLVRGEPRVNVSIRLSGNMHRALLSQSAQSQVSATAFVCGLIAKDLKQSTIA
ncbi:MAG: hypothetical protein ACK5TK_03290 [Betaproteobacteria bacterium]